jgi:transposase-like protein
MEEEPMGKRRRHSASTKARVAVEALRERKTVAQIASQYRVGATMVTRWKQQALQRMPELFTTARAGEDDKLVDSLYEQIGRLQVELAWLKKNDGLFVN